jgi:hypothetical protein
MKKLLSISLGCFLVTAALTFGANEAITFNDNNGAASSGTYLSTDTFSLDVFATWTGYTGVGLSYWLEAPNALAPNISITGETYFTWTDPNQTFFGSDPFNDTSGNQVGYMNEVRDLGGTSVFAQSSNVQIQNAGTYKVSNLNFSLSGAAAGTYTLLTQIISPHGSEITEGDSTGGSVSQHFLTTAGAYTITIVPEPATWSLLGLGGLAAVGLNVLRRRRSS